MSLNESMVEAAARESFGGQTRFARTLIPAFSQGEKEKYGEVVLVGRLRGAIRRPAGAGPAIPDRSMI